MSILKGFTTYSKGNNTAKDVSTANQTAARNLQYSIGNKTAAQLNTNVSTGYSPSYSASGQKLVSSSNSGSSSSKSSGSTSSGSTRSSSSYLSDLYSSYASQRQAALDDAYNSSKSTIENAFQSAIDSIADAYNSSSGLLQQNYDASNNALNTTYNNSLTGLKEDANQSLKEAYINKMLSQKNLNQQLAAQGLSGGATETTLASMLNNYGNSRNNINTTLNTNIRNLDANKVSSLADILNTYNSNLSSLNQYKASAEASAYQNKASALASLESSYANALADVLSDSYDAQISNLSNINTGYVDTSDIANYTGSGSSALTNALNKILGTSYTPTSATNTAKSTSTSQTGVNSITDKTNYELVKEALEDLLGLSS